MKRFLVLLATLLLFCLLFVGCGDGIGDGRDAVYKETVYKRSEFPNYNIELLETHRKYVGDFIETYDYGNTLPWEVFLLNDEENVLYSHHALWLKPDYSLPSEYGETFSKAEYVVSEGIMDDYKEETTPLGNFAGDVVLEDIIAVEPTELKSPTTHTDVRFYYAEHADIVIRLKLVSEDGVYYLSVRTGKAGDDVFYRINDGYVEMLTSSLKK